ncbi:uncharacterized protein LOC133192814 [Saccostrea echinata]|uniref:uncharacterized protein LOC133187143 n=1 Tax=Saccostrea echinata TaxID=191078 RepID=UPI002A82C55B|nr:uncharacterized protein LOC133187143 [Saccostrea echinata]XP_061184805.1 uncharacterized protein LOC133192814 [Saccostrea echinata]
MVYRHSKSDRILFQVTQGRNSFTAFDNGHRMMLGPSTMYVERKFPMQYIIENIEEIPHEFPLSFVNERMSFVGFISRYHHYRGHHCIYKQERNDAEIYVGFYLDYDNPYSYFTWGDVRLGKFICLHDPRIHYFLDASVGKRVKESSEAFFLMSEFLDSLIRLCACFIKYISVYTLLVSGCDGFLK